MRLKKRIYGLGDDKMMVREGEPSDIVQRGVKAFYDSEHLQNLKQSLSLKASLLWSRYKKILTDAGTVQWVRQMSLQIALYGLIVMGAVGVTFMGSNIMLSILTQKMTEMASDVVKTQVPTGIKTASLRPSLQ